ncbi:MAG: DASS family sodium-coupled anion symporter, partial [Proteobacteria bacterium]|nr:DASS family sodium-coupled anion symporter [Pseudomonadota bacterium]
VGADKPEKLLLSFMLTAFLLSMWISNTATTLMLLPIAIAITNKVEDPKFTIILLLGIAYAASIGGSSTPIGTPPNLIMIQNYQEATGIELGFIQWMKMVLPVVLIFLPIMYFVLKSSIIKNNVPMSTRIEKQAINTAQKRTLAVFLITAVLWMSRTAPFGGWKSWLDLPQANDASVALLAVIAMFIIPAGNNKKLLDWKTANQIPWGILLLFAGGITIATAFKSTGLSGLIAEQLMFLKHLPIWLIIFIICLAITFLTEITSNTATTAIMMPILVSAAIARDINPIKLMLPATISASCAFMLPVATAPNAIIYSSEKVPIKSMLKFGFKLNLIGAVIITIVSSFML